MNSQSILHFTDTRKGDTALVFLHYFGGSADTWHQVITELKNEFRCIAVDLPGFGDSQGEFEDLSVNFCAKEVAEVIATLELKQFILVGHSMGGKIALAVASKQPSGLLSLILVAPSPPTPEPMTDKARQQLLHAYGDRFALETLANTITARPLIKAQLATVIANNLKISKAAWSWWVEQGSREDISSQMAAIQVSVLVISGSQDPNFSGSFLQKIMTTYFPAALFEEIPGAGHLLPVEKPVNLARLIENFAIATKTNNETENND